VWYKVLNFEMNARLGEVARTPAAFFRV